MKKSIIFLFFVIFVLSCKKTRVTLPEDVELVSTRMANGLPENYKAIHGYMYLGESRMGTNPSKIVNMFAAFRDPGKDIMSLYNHISESPESNNFEFTNIVSVGAVNVDYFELDHELGNLFYSENTHMPDSIALFPRWIAEGNKTFKPFNELVSRGFPVITISDLIKDTILLGGDHTFNLKNFASNYDSLSITLASINPFSSNNISKRVRAGTPSITFTNDELMEFRSGSSNLFLFTIQLYNYSHKTVANKVHVFELSNKFTYHCPFKEPVDSGGEEE